MTEEEGDTLGEVLLETVGGRVKGEGVGEIVERYVAGEGEGVREGEGALLEERVLEFTGVAFL